MPPSNARSSIELYCRSSSLAEAMVSMLGEFRPLGVGGPRLGDVRAPRGGDLEQDAAAAAAMREQAQARAPRPRFGPRPLLFR